MFRTLLKNGILLYVQDPPVKWDFTFCSGVLLYVQDPPENGILLFVQDPSEKMGFYVLFKTLL